MDGHTDGRSKQDGSYIEYPSSVYGKFISIFVSHEVEITQPSLCHLSHVYYV